jgi:hypothetical protein
MRDITAATHNMEQVLDQVFRGFVEIVFCRREKMSDAKGSIPLSRSKSVVLSAISRTSTTRSFARTNAWTMPEPVVRP